MGPAADSFTTHIRDLLPDLERVYTDIHAHPELSMQETRTAGIAADRLRAAGFEVTTGVGKTGVVGLLRNGDGPTIMLRADMDALPVEEETDCRTRAPRRRPTAREARASDACLRTRHARDVADWSGDGVGADTRHMEGDTDGRLPAGGGDRRRRAGDDRRRIVTRFPKPDVVLGQHVMVGPAGAIGGRTA